METYVVYVSSKIILKNVKSGIISDLEKIGATEEKSCSWTIPYSNKDDLAEKFSKLRDLNIAFSEGRDWCPSAIFEEFREKGVISGKYKKIEWFSQNDNPNVQVC